MASDQGEGRHTPGPCGCVIENDPRGYRFSKQIRLCPLHTAAPALLAALRLIANKQYDDAVGRTAVGAARAAIALAEGKG